MMSIIVMPLGLAAVVAWGIVIAAWLAGVTVCMMIFVRQRPRRGIVVASFQSLAGYALTTGTLLTVVYVVFIVVANVGVRFVQ